MPQPQATKAPSQATRFERFVRLKPLPSPAPGRLMVP